MRRQSKCALSGFTLLELLIALFIFTILSTLLTMGLHTVINSEMGAERKATQLRELQMTFLVLSRDIEQAINRPVFNADHEEEPAFVGDEHGCTFTHTGYANPGGVYLQSHLQRIEYREENGDLIRRTKPVLDEVVIAKNLSARHLLTGVRQLHFEYLDDEKQFQSSWLSTASDKTLITNTLTGKSPLPHAVRISLTLADGGKISQLYLIPIKIKTASKPEPKVQADHDF